jgi:hypothetical protein
MGAEAERQGDPVTGGAGEPALVLWTDGLYSKWGFSDGDFPDDLEEWLEAEAQGLSWFDRSAWHSVLIRLVREFVIPRLDQAVTVCLVNTHHNPIRAVSVDGREITHWDHLGDGGRAPTLMPDRVSIPFSEVLRVMREMGTAASEGAEDTAAARRVAELLGVDPMAVTPGDQKRNYPHPFVPRSPSDFYCATCDELREHARHEVGETT